MVAPKIHTYYSDTNSFNSSSIEAGFVFLKGDSESWDAGGFPLGGQWNYWGPYISGEYGFQTKKTKEFGMDGEDLLYGGMLNVGVTGGVGALFLIIPISINGTIGYSTDFNNSAMKCSLGLNLKYVSLNMGTYIGQGLRNKNKYEGFVEVKVILWDKL